MEASSDGRARRRLADSPTVTGERPETQGNAGGAVTQAMMDAASQAVAEEEAIVMAAIQAAVGLTDDGSTGKGC